MFTFLALLISIGYDTGGDFDEAERVMKESYGIEIPDDPEVRAVARSQFSREFEATDV